MRSVLNLLGLMFAALWGAVHRPMLYMPRIIKHNGDNPFAKRLYGKVVAGDGGSGPNFARLLRPAAMAACMIALCLVASGCALHFGAVGWVGAKSLGGLSLANGAALVAKRNQLDAKRKELHAVFEAAGEDMDFKKPEVLKLLGASTTVEAVEKVRERNAEIEKIYDEAKQLSEVEGIKERLNGIGSDLKAPRHADPSLEQQGQPRALGDMIVETAAFKAYHESKGARSGSTELKGYGLREIKNTNFLTSAGWAPESLRTGKVVDAVTRPIQILDIIPVGQTDMADVKYMEETTRTHSAAEAAEAAAYAESAFVLTERTSSVRKIGDSIPVSDEQLEDVAMVQSYLNQRLTFGVRQRLDNQVIQGNGTPPNLRGIMNVSGIQTQAKGTDPVPDAIYKALVLVRITGRAFPSHVLLHPNDWQDIRLLRTADGIYIWGSPSEAGPERIWGLPVVQSDALTQNTGIVGDFPNFCMLFERRGGGIDIQVGYINDQFTKGMRTIRADLRAAFVAFRAAAFCTVTGI